MPSLTSCIKKAGDALRAEDRAAILARAAVLRGKGEKNAAASLQAVEEQLAAVRADLQALDAPAALEAREPSAVYDTEAFRRWFGDSKVVDAQGKPLVVFHGTARDFEQFAPESHFGTRLSASKRLRMRGVSEGARLYPVYLSIQNPKRVEDRAIYGKKAEWDAAVDVAKLEGYDGIVYENKVEGGESWVAFRPEQIKSATGNSGAFDPANPSIVRDRDAPYTSDLFGDPVPRPAKRGGPARAAAAPATADGDTPAPAGEYAARTIVGREVQRELGATVIRTAHDAAAATRYLYRSAVERMDGIVVDAKGKPLAVVGGFKGSIDQTSVFASTIVAEAVRVPGAAAIWLSHNHPSGMSMLSRADHAVHASMRDVLRGSGIELKGLIAVGDGSFGAVTSDPLDETVAAIPPSKATMKVPVIERELRPSAAALPMIQSPADAARVARPYYAAGGNRPGMILLDSQHHVLAWVPLPDVTRGQLRGTGGLNLIYRAVSEANAGAVVLVHGGELDAPIKPGITAGQNIGAALSLLDVRVLDQLNAKTGASAAERGEDLKVGPVFSRAKRDAAAAEGDLLSSQSEEDLRAKAQREAGAAKADAAEQKRLADKAKADAMRDEFVLTGSDRAVDVGAAGGQGSLFSRMTPERRDAAFRAWSGDAPMVTSAQALGHEFRTGEKVVVEAFHGTKRPDRIGGEFKPSRATSGPMSFFTSDPEVASSYAQNKGDTSLAYEDTNYESWFKFTPPGERGSVDIVRAWYRLTPQQRDRVAELAPRVTFDMEGDGIVLGPEGHNSGTGSYDYQLEATKRDFDRRGNPMKALLEDWLNSGNLINDEEEFLKVLRLAGFPVQHVQFDSPRAEFPAVIHGHVAFRYPLVTGDIPQSVLTALRESAKRDRTRKSPGGGDIWDKNSRTIGEWLDAFGADGAEYVWTSIPDKVTAVLKGLGYDGIIDTGGKGGGLSHRVYIPFTPQQFKGQHNRGTYDPAKRGFMTSRGEGAAGAMSPQRVTAIADAIRKTWANAPEVVVVADMRDPRVPAVAREADSAQRSQGAAGAPRGFFLDGRVYLVANGLHTDAQVAEVLMHESLGHFGLRGTFGTAFDSILDRVAQLRAGDVRRKAEEYGLDPKDRTQRRIAAEEVLAELAQTRPELSVVQRAIAAIRAWLRANVPMLMEGRELTDAEVIRDYLEPARLFVERGASAGQAAADRAAFSLPAPPFYSALARGLEGLKTAAAPGDMATARRDADSFAHNIGLMTQYPNFEGVTGSIDAKAEAMVEQMVDNLVWLHDAVPKELRARSREWYAGGNRIAHRWADRFGLRPEVVAGVIAATSPQKDWFQNVSLAERILEAVVNRSQMRWDSKMSDTVRWRDWGNRLSREVGFSPVQQLKRLEGKTLRDLYDPNDAASLFDMAVWIRAWDEAHNPQAARIISPEGNFGDFDRAKSGEPVALRWQNFATIAKTLQILMTNDLGAISQVIGSNHKVRSFYNNLIAPAAGEDVAIDTHAVAAALLRPLASSAPEVMHNFGGNETGTPGPKNSAITGLFGTYAIYADAYRRAAERRDMLPREMQSITWEAVRGLFRPEQKNEKIKAQADGIWRQASTGELNANDARKRVKALVGGIERPAWAGSPPGQDEARVDSSYADELPGAGLPGRGAGSAAGRGAGLAAASAAERVAFSRAPVTTTVRTPSGTRTTTVARSAWRDATNRVQFAPGQWLYNVLDRAATPLLDKLQLRAASPELRRMLRQMKLDVAKAQETAVAVARDMQAFSEGDRLMVSDIIERELAAGVAPPAHAVRLAAVMNQAMATQTKELVRLGMLSEESAARWDGAYLPRFYESKVGKQVGDAWADAVRRITGRTSVMAGIKGKHLKGRGLYETVPVADLEQWLAMGWEVRDPDYDPDPAQRSMLPPDGTVQVWRDFTREERESMGEIRDAGFRFVMGYMQTQRDIAIGRLFEQLANDPEHSSRTQREGWVRVPDGTVEGTGAKKYGALAGRYVPPSVLSQLSALEEAQSAAWQFYRKAMGIWKMGKTSMNPVSHMNNVLSNLSMAHFAGVSYHRADKYVGAFRDFIIGAPMMQEAKDAGLFLGTMNAEELVKDLPPELRDLVAKSESTTVRGARLVFDMMTFFLRKPLGAAYEAEDLYFRYLIYKDARQRGMEPQEAVDHAQRFIFTYDDLPKGARMIRDFGMPFFAYTYKAIPALLHTALTHPHRMLAPAAVMWGANALAYAIATDDDDEWQEALRKFFTDDAFRERVREKQQAERKHLPPWMKGTTALLTPKAIRLGMDEVTELPLFLDVARIVPGGDIFDVNPNAGGLPLPQPLTPSHPLFSIGVAMLANVDLWTGKDLVTKGADTSGEAAQKRLEWLWRQVSPAVAVGNSHWERTLNALAQGTGHEVQLIPGAPEALSKTYTGVGRDGQPVQPAHAAMQTFGIKVRPVDLDLSEKIDASNRQRLIRDIDAQLRTMRRLNAKGAISDKALDEARENAALKKERLREGLTVDGGERD